MADVYDLMAWMRRDLQGKFYNDNSIIHKQITKYGVDENGDPERYISHTFFLYTATNEYVISQHHDYLGAGVSSRKPRPGETWTRGNDLADGKLSEDTWKDILRDIISCELESVSKDQKLGEVGLGFVEV